MVRVLVSLDVGAHAHDELGIVLKSSSGLLLVGMIVIPLSIISMAIFACGDDYDDNLAHSKRKWSNRKGRERGGFVAAIAATGVVSAGIAAGAIGDGW